MKSKCKSNQCLRVGEFENGICPKCTNLMKQGFKKRKPIKKMSKKRSIQNKEYLKIREQFLKDNPKCKVCGKDANQIHHAKGRINALLSDLSYFIAVCGQCHTKIELNPLWAKENDYSLNRTAND